MEQSECCVEAGSRGTLSGTPGPWLAAAWRDAAEQGGPACVLIPRDGALVVAWANRALGALLGRDVGDVTGRALSEFAEPDAGPAGQACGPRPPAGSAMIPVVPPDPEPQPGEPVGRQAAAEIGWARLAHRLARAAGGSGAGTLRRVDGAQARVRVVVTAVDVAEHLDATGTRLLGPVAGISRRVSVPGQGRGGGAARGSRTAGRSAAPEAGYRHLADPALGTPAAGDPMMPARDPVLTRGPEGRPASPGSGGRVSPPGVVGELPSTDGPRCWLVELDPVHDALADAQHAVLVAEHRFTALAGCAPVGIFASEAGLRLGYVNEYFVGLTGVTTNALLGNGWLDVVHSDDLPAVYAAVQTVLNGTPVQLAVRLSARQDVPRWLQLRLAPTTTPSRAAGFLGTAEDVTERRSWEEHLTYQAQHDPLTGLVNRRRLLEVLSELLTSRRGRDREFAILFLDLDGFKEVNDTLGHDAGDRALVEVARRLQRVARDSDLLARVAGDEFVVVLRSIASEPEAEAAARRHLAALAAPVRIGTADVRLTASIGVALPAGFDTPDSLLRAADRVMYEAKAAGHGLYRLAPVGPGREGR